MLQQHRLQRVHSLSLTFLALVLADVSCTLQVIQSEDVLQLRLVVDYGSAALLLSLF